MALVIVTGPAEAEVLHTTVHPLPFPFSDHRPVGLSLLSLKVALNCQVLEAELSENHSVFFIFP